MDYRPVFEAIEKLSDQYLAVWKECCEIESPSGYKEGVDCCGRYFMDMAQAHGWKTEVLEQPVSGNAVCMTMNDDVQEKPLALSGHIDTVHPVGTFGDTPVRMDGDIIYGPGVCDCKGGVVAGMLAGYYHDKIGKLVMLTPAASLRTDALEGTCMGTRYDPLHIPEQVLVGKSRAGGLYFRTARTLPIHEVTAQFTGPALAVIGGADAVVHAEEIRRYGECMPRCQVLEYPALDHGLFGADHAVMLQKVVSFLQD